jgi:hypothetical protein
MLMKLESRSVFGWPATRAGVAHPRNGIVVHFDGSRQGLASKTHDACRTYWKNTRLFHMGPDRGWLDIGYSFAACPHGIVMEGRGRDHEQAAQPGGNTTWYSCTFMSGPGEAPTDAQVEAFQELRDWLRGMGMAAAMKGHRNFISTDCPGEPLYDMVTSGTLIRKEPSKPIEEDHVKRICVLEMSSSLTVDAGKTKSVPYSKEYVDGKKMHTDATKDVPAGYPSVFPMEDGDYLVHARVTVDGLKVGDRITLMIAGYERNTNDIDYIAHEKTVIGDGRDNLEADVFRPDALSKKNKYRLNVSNPNGYPVTITKSQFSVSM